MIIWERLPTSQYLQGFIPVSFVFQYSPVAWSAVNLPFAEEIGYY
jgi:hypothetical protein